MSGERDISENIRVYEAEGAGEGFACVAFGGIAQGIGVPVFEFFRTLSVAGISSLFIKDPSQGWYQKPIPDIGADPHRMAEHIGTVVRDNFPGKPIVAIGNSMGGYAAIAFSCLCGFERTVVFSPQTFISPELRALHQDDRWKEHMARIPKLFIDDLRPLVQQHRPKVQIYAGAKTALDVVHAEHLSGLDGISITLLPMCGHDASAWMRNQGLLDKAILDAGRELTAGSDR